MFNQYGWQPAQQVIRVNGENGARALSMQPNSSALVLDETAPLVWLCVTDGAGYKTVTPYTITAYKPEAAPSLKDINDRLTRLEGLINESYNRSDERHGQQPAKSGAEDV